MAPSRPAPGRPVATSHAEIERAAFGLFAAHGFDGTTLDAIATAVGVGRRTLFRYFESKNDIPWGQFDRTLDDFREILRGQPGDLPLWEAVHRSVVDFNRFDLGAEPSHRDRMRLILTTPTLQAHSVLRYEEWRLVIAEHVAEKLGVGVGDLLPRLVGQVSLALALSSYATWLADDTSDLIALLEESMGELRTFLDT